MLCKVNNWKEVSESFYEKSVVLSLLLVLFISLTMPHIETKPYTKIPDPIPLRFIPEAEQKVIPKPEMIKTHIIINFEDELSADDPDIPIIQTIEKTLLTEEVHIVDVPKFFNIYEFPPVIEKRIPPLYPKFMKEMKIEGTVHLEAIISETGDVIKVNILKSVFAGDGGLDEAAIAAVLQWKFQPATSGNNPVKCSVSLPITFKLQ